MDIQIDLLPDLLLSEIESRLKWCFNQFGEPGDRWAYGKKPNFFSGGLINHPGEIEYFIFSNLEDATIYKLKYGD